MSLGNVMGQFNEHPEVKTLLAAMLLVAEPVGGGAMSAASRLMDLATYARACCDVRRYQKRLGIDDDAMLRLLLAYDDSVRQGLACQLAEFLADFTTQIEREREEQAFVQRVTTPPQPTMAEILQDVLPTNQFPPFMPPNEERAAFPLQHPSATADVPGRCAKCGSNVKQHDHNTICGNGHLNAGVVPCEKELIPHAFCNVCGAPVSNTVFGTVCDNGHGGAPYSIHEPTVPTMSAPGLSAGDVKAPFPPGSRVSYQLGDQTHLGNITHCTATHADLTTDSGAIYRQVAVTHLQASTEPVSLRALPGPAEVQAAQAFLAGASLPDRQPQEVLVDIFYRELTAPDGTPIVLILDVINGDPTIPDTKPYLLYRIENTQRQILSENQPEQDGEVAGTRELVFQGQTYRLEVDVTSTKTTTPKKAAKKRAPKAAATPKT